MQIFGYQFVRVKDNPDKEFSSFTPKATDDGAVTIAASAFSSQYVDLEGTVRTEAELITRYMKMALNPEIIKAVDEITNEAVTRDDDGEVVKIFLDNVDISPNLKKLIEAEFENVKSLLRFNVRYFEIFKRWYIDGRLYYHAIIDEKNLEQGIQELRYVDPRKIKKVREVVRKKSHQSPDSLFSTKNEYYIYNDRGFNPVGIAASTPTASGIRIAKDSIVFVTSGLVDTNQTMVLSYLHQAIKALNELRTLEDATVIYRITRAPERRVWYIDIGQLPNHKAEQYVRDVMANHKNRMIYDCLAMDTKVPLLDGRTLTLDEITKEFNEGKRLWAYSCDPKTGEFAPGLITWSGVARKNEKVLKITLDNDKEIVCTHDHKFPVWNKGFVEAKDLAIGESMIPFYAREKTIVSKNSTYQQILQNETNEWEFTHRLVSGWKDKNDLLNEWTFKNEHIEKRTVHHKNYDRHDNTPENLTRMNSKDHLLYHRQHNSLAGKIGGKVTAQRRRDLGLPFFLNLSEEKRIETARKNGKILGDRKLGFHQWSLEERNAHNIKASKILSEKLANDPEFRKKFTQAQRNAWTKEKRAEKSEFSKLQYKGQMNKNEECSICGIVCSIGNISRWHNENCKELRNHKIKNIEYLDQRIDTGTLCIDGDEIYHNYHTFALDAGIYTKNSMTGEIKDDRRFMTMLEDYWLPRREGGRGTEVTTLKGGESLGKMEDVEYFQKKLFNSLNIPVARLEPENSIVSIGGSGTLSREELKFSKFVDRLGQRFATLFTEVLEKQLVLKKIFSIEEFLVFKDMIEYEFSKDNYFTELKAQEVLTARMNALMALQPFIGMYYSNEWVRKEILKQDDKQIRDMDKQIEEEQENYQYLPPDQKMMLQQQEQQDQQMAGEQDQQAQQAASPMGQAQQTSAAVKQNPNPSLQDMSKGKRANKMLGSGTN